MFQIHIAQIKGYMQIHYTNSAGKKVKGQWIYKFKGLDRLPVNYDFDHKTRNVSTGHGMPQIFHCFASQLWDSITYEQQGQMYTPPISL
jgi:hypothetical protein